MNEQDQRTVSELPLPLTVANVADPLLALAPIPERRPSLTPIALLIVILIAYFVIQVKAVVILLVVALLFATVIERPVNALQRRHVPRAVSILIVYVTIIGTIAVAAYLLAPTIADEWSRFRVDAPVQLRELQTGWRVNESSLLRGPGVNTLDTVIRGIQQPPAIPEEYARGLVTGIGGGLIGLITVLVVAFYYLMEKAFTRRILVTQLSPAAGARVNRIWDDVETQVGRWMRGQMTLCLIIGIASTIAYGLMDVRFWPVLGLIAGITEALPIVGPWIGGIPAVAMALTQSWQLAAMVALFAFALQMTENWILVPRVMKGAVGLTPLTVFVALLVGTEFMGIVGALLAIPIAAAIQVIISDYLRARRETEVPGQPVSNWRWIGGRFTQPQGGATVPGSGSGRRRSGAATAEPVSNVIVVALAEDESGLTSGEREAFGPS